MTVVMTLSKVHQWAPPPVTVPNTATSLPQLTGTRPQRDGSLVEVRRALPEEFEVSISLPTESTTRSWRA